VFDAAPSLTHVKPRRGRSPRGSSWLSLTVCGRRSTRSWWTCRAPHALGSEGCWPTRLAVKRGWTTPLWRAGQTVGGALPGAIPPQREDGRHARHHAARTPSRCRWSR